MSRISALFERLKKQREAALVPFITAGDPDMATTAALVKRLIECGADMIEIGVPFSDPMADGPTIQAASQRALDNEFSIASILELVANVRCYSSVPVILFGYYNPFYQYGLARLAADAGNAGVDAFLVVDLPPEEAGPMKDAAAERGMDTIFLLAPTSTDERIRAVAEQASGFIYFVSVTGVTGARSSIDASLGEYVARVRSHSTLPVGIGFGISSPEHVREIAGYADAVIVGSAIIRIIEEYRDSNELLGRVGDFIRSLKDATGKN